MLLGAACTSSASEAVGGTVSDEELEAATLHIEVRLCGNSPRQQATAVVLRPKIAATVAHTFLHQGEVRADTAVSGDTVVPVDTVVVFDAEGNEIEAELLFIDPETDVALLSLARARSALSTGRFEAADETSRLVLFPADADGPSVAAISVIRETTATLDGVGARRALELRGSVESGDSGAPVIDDAGRVIGIVFATSTGSETSWAIAASEFEEAMAQSSEPVELSCE